MPNAESSVQVAIFLASVSPVVVENLVLLVPTAVLLIADAMAINNALRVERDCHVVVVLNVKILLVVIS
jgi:hypothetical protein